MHFNRFLIHGGLLLLMLAAFDPLMGCGWLADPDRIVVAKVGGEPIRREDLSRLLRDMLEGERPHIRTRNDLINVLENHIDQMIKREVAAPLEEQRLINIPRDQAAAVFDAQHPEFAGAVAHGGAMGLSQAEITFYKTEREFRIDAIEKDLLGDAALDYLVQQALDEGTISVTDEEFQLHYDIQRDQLVDFETVSFDGLIIPRDQESASAIAVQAADRLEKGESIEDIAAEYEAAKKGMLIRSNMRNDPALAYKFGSFWENVSGSKAGDIVGPIFIEGWEAARRDDQGNLTSMPILEAYLVCRIIAATPQTQKTLEEAKPDLAPLILRTKMMQRLREEKGVEIFRDKVPDPAAFDSSAPKSVFEAE